MRKPTKAMLFDPVAQSTHQITYDRTDRRTVEAALGGTVLATPIIVTGLARWTVYVREQASASAGFGLRVIPDGTEYIFAGPVVLVSNRGLYEYDVDLDLLWPTFDFWWSVDGDRSNFKLGHRYDSLRQPL